MNTKSTTEALVEISLQFEEHQGVGFCIACDEKIYGKIFIPFVYINEERKNALKDFQLCESCYYLIEDK